LNYDYYLISSNNVASFDVFIDGFYIGENVEYFQVNSGSSLRVIVTKEIDGQDATILFETKLV